MRNERPTPNVEVARSDPDPRPLNPGFSDERGMVDGRWLTDRPERKRSQRIWGLLPEPCGVRRAGGQDARGPRGPGFEGEGENVGEGVGPRVPTRRAPGDAPGPGRHLNARQAPGGAAVPRRRRSRPSASPSGCRERRRDLLSPTAGGQPRAVRFRPPGSLRSPRGGRAGCPRSQGRPGRERAQAGLPASRARRRAGFGIEGEGEGGPRELTCRCAR